MKLLYTIILATLINMPQAWATDANDTPQSMAADKENTAPNTQKINDPTPVEADEEDEDESLFTADTVRECDSAYLEAVMFCSTGDSNMFCVKQRLRELIKCVTRVKNTPVCKAYQTEKERCKSLTDPKKTEECKAEARMQTQWLDCHR